MTALALFFAASQASPLQELHLTVEGIDRVALIDIPPTAKGPSPLVFGFHGHGGNMRNAARTFDVRRYWPEAIIIYPQGLATATKNDPKGERPGWQNVARLNGDRDLKFFDALLSEAKVRLHADPKRVFAMGHSNGGGFTYLLMRERPSAICAYGPSSAGAGGKLGGSTPRPVFHIAGTRDPLVPFENQQKTIDGLLDLNKCSKPGEKWSEQCTFYPSKTAPVATFISDVGHVFQRNAMPFMVRFFKSVTPGT